MATTQLAPDFKEFLQLLRSAKIEYLPIGGYKHASGRHQDLTDLEKLP